MSPSAIVTGAASGIGAATVDRLRAAGWQVAGIDLRPADGTVSADVSDADSLAAAARQLGEGRLDALVCAAGVMLADDRYATVDMTVWERTWAVNVTGTMLTLRTFAPRLAAGSAVLTVASMAALVGMPRRDAYTASKGAIVALTRAWATDLIRRGIRVNCVCPGVTRTPMTEAALSRDDVSLPLGRPATPGEIAEVIVAAVGTQTTYLNGAIIPVDGGLTSAAGTVDLAPRAPLGG